MAILLNEENPLHASPALYVVATPLGNRLDISLRALAVLRVVGTIAAEDTRHSLRLLDAHGINAKMLALHEHNEQEGATRIIALLEAGQHVALITDAGTPAVSDPGARLVARVQEAGFPVVPVPGACAAIAALSASGLAAAHFHFHGFLPPKPTARRTTLEGLRGIDAALVFYEAPHRVLETVEDLAAVLEPERELVFARELTKLFEQIARMPLGAALEWLRADPNRQRGEFVLLVGPAPQSEGLPPEAERVLKLLLAELPLKTAARLAAEITGAAKNALYELGLRLKA
ncbi:16S rRNA (cytidine(1402)-2'-O)-methyltransferase [Uliginosibacterium aquaticum]|uniref:Ribosomal RNA small subunit methyltransferase I n=1 Tax=Uliginosibacterium aquaticum TaxID=2731212 RepID=A0ABX2IJN5_9RHOO|nr:16S rRNA (cytidine(1402)-2'-O)-methyltransferase [Uliginosibacterium aquaticum]NSL56512.1 16S rRNA (cytidine(1402)-2'-O)-methyltransferase [Uliginosibacterium aquaticum]